MEREIVNGKHRRKRFRFQCSGSWMMVFAIVTLMFYTVSMSVFQNGLLNIGKYNDLSELSDAVAKDPVLMGYSTGAALTQLIGALAIPVLAFLLTERFKSGESFSRMFFPMLICAVISEVPYDFAINSNTYPVLPQNLMVTFVICMIMLYGLRLLTGKKGIKYRLGQGFIILAAILWGSFLQTAFSIGIVLLTAVYYLFDEKKTMRIIAGCGVSLMYVTAPLSSYLLWSYDGEQCGKKYWYLFYILYPVHLGLFGLISWFIQP